MASRQSHLRDAHALHHPADVAGHEVLVDEAVKPSGFRDGEIREFVFDAFQETRAHTQSQRSRHGRPRPVRADEISGAADICTQVEPRRNSQCTAEQRVPANRGTGIQRLDRKPVHQSRCIGGEEIVARRIQVDMPHVRCVQPHSVDASHKRWRQAIEEGHLVHDIADQDARGVQLRARTGLALDHRDASAGLGQCIRAGKSGETGADDDAVLVHAAIIHPASRYAATVIATSGTQEGRPGMQPHRTFPLALGMALLLCAKLASPADAAPKVVLQIGHQAPVRAVLWTTDSRRLFTLAEDGSIVVWDVTRNVPGGVIIDHARIPWPEGGRVLAFMTNPDGASARITLQLGPAAAATHDINLQTREVTPVPVAASPFPATSLFPPSPDGRWSVEQNHGNGVSGIFSASDENIQFDEADCTSRTRCRYGVNLLGTGQAPVKLALTGNPRSYFLDLDLARDGRRLLRLESIRNETASRVQQLDIDSGAASSFSPDGAFHRVEWLEGERYALFSHGYNVTNDVAQGGLPPAMLVDPACSAAGGKACSRVAAHAMMRPLGTDIFVGAGSLRDCFRAPPAVGDTGPDGVWCLDEDVEDNDGHRKEPRLQVYARGASKAGTSAWTTRTVAELAGLDITAIEVARDRHSIAIAARSADASSVILMLDASPSVAARVLWRGTAQDDRSDSLPGFRS